MSNSNKESDLAFDNLLTMFISEFFLISFKISLPLLLNPKILTEDLYLHLIVRDIKFCLI